MARRRGLSVFRAWLVEDNLGLAVHFVNKLAAMNEEADKEELDGVARLALLNAARMFDLTRGYAFSSYATGAILHECRKSLLYQKSRRMGVLEDEHPHEFVERRNGVPSDAVVRRAVGMLTPEMRRVVRWKSDGACASRLGISVLAARERRRVAYRVLRRMLGYEV